MSDLEICKVCVLLIEYGEYQVDRQEEDRAHAGLIERWGKDYGRRLFNAGDQDEGRFSQSPCDGCGDRHGGNRYPAVAHPR